MKVFWYLLFASQPQFFLLAVLGVLGKTAKEASDDVMAAMALVLLIGVFIGVPVAAVYFALHAFGVV